MPEPAERQALADAVHGVLLEARHDGDADPGELTDRILACVDEHHLTAPWCPQHREHHSTDICGTTDEPTPEADETMVDLGGGMVVPLAELLEDDEP